MTSVESTGKSVQKPRSVPLPRARPLEGGVADKCWWSDAVWVDLVSGSWCDLPGGPAPLLRVSSVDLWRRHSLIRVVVDTCVELPAPCTVVIEVAWEDRELVEFAIERSRDRCRVVEVRWRSRDGAQADEDLPWHVYGVVQK